MHKLLLFAVATSLVAATTVALASASRTAPHASAVTPGQEAANAYLPAGDTPITDNWYLPDGDHAQTGFSQLKQINSTNAGGLHLVWSAALDPLWIAANRGIQNAPICCPDGNLVEPMRDPV